ncbi:MAG: hypothetical protein KDK24_20220 [Pseudooceanicola sp.]|nr:hypothetical protein [Pseudooceanicola sp.]
MQKHVAIGAVLLVVALLLAANARLLVAAIGSQPACVAASAAPAKRAC